MKILLVEDEKLIRQFIVEYFQKQGEEVIEASDGYEGLSLLDDSFDLVLLDIMMPGRDGIAVLREYRKSGGKAPILILTARDAVEDRVVGLDAGADDYLVKPFMFPELLARIRVLLRRNTSSASSSVLECGDLVMDTSSHAVRRRGRKIDLSAKEYSILEYMMRNQGAVLGRESFRSHIWSWDYDGESNVIDVYIRYLRKKIDDGESVKLIHTIRGAGYMLKDGNE